MSTTKHVATKQRKALVEAAAVRGLSEGDIAALLRISRATVRAKYEAELRAWLRAGDSDARPARLRHHHRSHLKIAARPSYGPWIGLV